MYIKCIERVCLRRLLFCLHAKCTSQKYAISYTKAQSHKNLDGGLPFTTSGCLCTLGIRPRPMALRMAFAIFLWFFGRRPVALECFIRPVSFMYSDMIVKF